MTEWAAHVTEWAARVTEWAARVTEWAAHVTEWAAHVTEWTAHVTEWAAHVTEWTAHMTECAVRADVLKCQSGGAAGGAGARSISAAGTSSGKGPSNSFAQSRPAAALNVSLGSAVNAR